MSSRPTIGLLLRHFAALVKADGTAEGTGHRSVSSTSALFPVGVGGVCLHVLPLVARPFSPDRRLTGIEAVGPSCLGPNQLLPRQHSDPGSLPSWGPKTH